MPPTSNPALAEKRAAGRVVVSVDAGDGEGGERLVVLGGEDDALFDAGQELFQPEAGVVVDGVGVDALVAERALLDAPAGGEGFAGAVDVEVFGGLDRAVQLDEL